MKNTKGFMAILPILILTILVGGSVYLYTNSKQIVEAPVSVDLATTSVDTNLVATGTTDEENVTPVVLTSIQKCEAEVRDDIIKLKPVLIGVSFVEIKSFTSGSLAKQFLTARGYTNPSGHSTNDITSAGDTNDFAVAIIKFESLLPSKKDGNKELVNMVLTQPIVCVNGSISAKSKIFVTETLKNEAGVRAALYQSGEVTD